MRKVILYQKIHLGLISDFELVPQASISVNRFECNIARINKYLPVFIELTRISVYEDNYIDRKIAETKVVVDIDEKRLFKEELAGRTLIGERQEVERVMTVLCREITGARNIAAREIDYKVEKINRKYYAYIERG